MRSPIKWYGGKGTQAAKIVKYFPKHTTYIEVFFGSGAVFFAKEPSNVEVINDLNKDVVNFFRVLRDEKKSEKLFKLLALTPYSRAEYGNAVKMLEVEADPVKRAAYFFNVVRSSFGGDLGAGWRFDRTHNYIIASWLASVDRLPETCKRLLRCQVENSSFEKLIPRFDHEDAFFYCDPPYVASTRAPSMKYKHEMGRKQHNELVNILLNIKGTAILSGYASDVYEPLEKAGWNRVDYTLKLQASLQRFNACQTRTESLWIHPRIKI